MYEYVRVFKNTLHSIGICYKVWRKITSVKLHTFYCFPCCFRSFSFFYCDYPFFSYFFYCVCDYFSYFCILIRCYPSNAFYFLSCFNFSCHFFELLNTFLDCFFNPLSYTYWVCSCGYKF